MSNHRVDIITIDNIQKHPDDETRNLELVHVGGWQCCVRKGQFKEGDKAIYIEPDFLVPTGNPAFSFLGPKREYERIKVKRLRGCISQGLIVNVPRDFDHLEVGTNMMDALGIYRYEPEMAGSSDAKRISSYCFAAPPHSLYTPIFDVESWQRHTDLFEKGEDVVVTEKIHGANARYAYAKNENGDFMQFCGSRKKWMPNHDGNIWWRAFNSCPGIKDWCEHNPGMVLYGEVFGWVQSLRYGAKPGEVNFAWFGMLDGNRWLDVIESFSTINMKKLFHVPVLYQGDYDIDIFKELAEQDSSVPGANHMREGVVILPMIERITPKFGRVQLKLVSNRYLEGGR